MKSIFGGGRGRIEILLMGIRDIPGHGCEAKERIFWKGKLWNKEAISPIVPWYVVFLINSVLVYFYRQSTLTSFVLNFDLTDHG